METLEILKKNTIWDYFDDNIQCPRNILHDILPYGVVWSNISSTFLNGFINYVKPINIFQIDRYTTDEHKLNVSYRDGVNLKKFTGSKADFRSLVIKGKAQCFHTELYCFEDDIVILAEVDREQSLNNKGRYVFFWFDSDVSDCVIGKFETDDSKEDVVNSVINWLEGEKENNKGNNITEDYDGGIINYTELPISFLSGWLNF